MKQLFFQLTLFLLVSSFANITQAIEDKKWQFELKLPILWMAEVNGTIDFEDNSIVANRSFKETMDTLTFGIMTELYAQKGPWVFALKLNYEESEDSFITEGFSIPPSTIPIIPRHKVKMDITQGTADATVGYEFNNGLQLFTGVRHVFSTINLQIAPLEPGIIDIEGKFELADEKFYDWLVGAKYQYQFTPNWDFRIAADFALAGDNDTDYSGEFIVNYRISKLNNAWVGYRYLKIVDEFSQDGVDIETDFVTKGPMLGWTFTF